MGTKLNPGRFNCYAAALPDEPLFTLLARDPTAPEFVRRWGDYRMARINNGQLPFSDTAGAAEAPAVAHAMEEWRTANDGRWRTEKAPPDPAPDLLAALRIARDHVQVALEAAIEEMDEGGHPAEWRAEAEATAKTLQDHVHQIDAAIAKAEAA